MGMKSHAILSAAADVSRSIFFAAAIIIAAFLPLFTLERRRRQHFRADGADLCLCAGRRAAGDVHGDAGAQRDHPAVAHGGNRNPDRGFSCIASTCRC
jgi:hypothetical protein